MSKIVEINGELLLELDENERRFMEMFIRCIDIKDSKYKLWLDEDIDLYNEFINGLKDTITHLTKKKKCDILLPYKERRE